MREYAMLLKGIKMNGIESSYTYLVSAEGKMLYHPTASKVGKMVENEVILDVAAQLQAGRTPGNDSVVYDFEGTMKYAAYAITSDKMIVVVTADQDELLAPVNKMVFQMGMLAVANMADCLEETNGFLENTVLTEYKEFEQVSEQYQQDADVFKTSMNGVQEAMADLADSIEAIANALNGINETVGESTMGVTAIAEKTSSMVERTGTAHEMVSECHRCVEGLREIVNRFVVE